MINIFDRCFIGKRRMEKAIKQFSTTHPDVNFQLQFLPYQLDPTRTEPANKLETYYKKFGEARFKQMMPQVTSVAAGEGIQLAFGGVLSNTFDSHRLIWWSKKFDKQNEVAEQVMHLYFEENKDVSDHENLAIAAEKAGLNKQEALDFINGEDGASEVKALLRDNNLGESRIDGVPHYTINDK
jgi:predicted DsbA family dithiol-disulfide isomerase